jgi:NADP-dependent 3-hydroxy acid dehydrogenase YdfG
MKKTILVCGHGPGISDAVAHAFGAQGFKVGLVARSKDKLDAAVKRLADKGVEATAFACDLGDAKAVKSLVADAQKSLGPITVLHWNAYGGGGAADLTACDTDALVSGFNIGVTGLVAAVQASLSDLAAQKDAGAVLVTGGGFAYYDANLDKMAVQWGASGLAVAKAAQHKTVGLLHEKLSAQGVYVGEVTVLGMVKGTAFDSGHATLEASAVAEKFWQIYTGRTETYVTVG